MKGGGFTSSRKVGRGSQSPRRVGSRLKAQATDSVASAQGLG
jgi:hypothetical protein